MPSTMRAWEYLLYPELRQFAHGRQAGALKAAAGTGFDPFEYVGLAVALVATALLTRYSAADMGLADRFGAAIANFIVAIPLLLVLAGPVLRSPNAARLACPGERRKDRDRPWVTSGPVRYANDDGTARVSARAFPNDAGASGRTRTAAVPQRPP
jgi:hypothetical protein